MPPNRSQAQYRTRTSNHDLPPRAGNDQTTFKVDRIITDRINRGRRQFLVTWCPAKIKQRQERVDQSNMPYITINHQAVLVDKTLSDARTDARLLHNEKLVTLRSTWMNKSILTALNEEARMIVQNYESRRTGASVEYETTITQGHNAGDGTEPQAERSQSLTTTHTQGLETTLRTQQVAADAGQDASESDQTKLTTEAMVAFLKDWPDCKPIFGHDLYPMVEYQLSTQAQLGSNPSQLTSRLLKLKRRRPIMLVKTFFDVRSMIRKCRLDASGVRAFVLQAVGGIMKRRCQRCKSRNGPFDKCIVDVERKKMFKRDTTTTDKKLCFNGACACCSYAGIGPKCTFHISPQRAQPDIEAGSAEDDDMNDEPASSAVVSSGGSSPAARQSALTPPSSPPSIAASSPVLRSRTRPSEWTDDDQHYSRHQTDRDRHRRQHQSDSYHYHDQDRYHGRGVNVPWPVNIHTTIGPQARSGYTPDRRSQQSLRQAPSLNSDLLSGHSRQAGHGRRWR